MTCVHVARRSPCHARASHQKLSWACFVSPVGALNTRFERFRAVSSGFEQLRATSSLLEAPWGTRQMSNKQLTHEGSTLDMRRCWRPSVLESLLIGTSVHTQHQVSFRGGYNMRRRLQDAAFACVETSTACDSHTSPPTCSPLASQCSHAWPWRCWCHL
jgi:hypothetical protein